MNIGRIVKGLKPTIRLYLEDPYLRECQTFVARAVKEKGRRWYVVTEQTVFHPRGGGQPSDTGIIAGPGWRLEVAKVFSSSGVTVHWGRLSLGDGVSEGDKASLSIDWRQRYLVMRLHTAGHLIDYVLATIRGRLVETLGAFHGPPRAYVDYAASPPTMEELSLVERGVNRLTMRGGRVRWFTVQREELENACRMAPNLGRLPKLDEYRIVDIEGVNAIPCTGTHVRDLSEIGVVKILGAEKKEEGFRLFYTVEERC